MKFHNFTYLLKQGVKSVFSNKLMSFSCIGVLVACMLLIGGAVIFTVSVNNAAGDLQKQTDIVAYLNDGLTKDQTEKVTKSLSDIDNIYEVKFSSKDDVLDEMKIKMGTYGKFFDGLSDEENPFPGTYVLRLSDPALTEETVKRVEGISGISEVKASIVVAEFLVEIKQIVYYAGAAVVLILILVSLAIITNTIKITIFSRRKEINIMKYVGATDGFIRLPFIVEGVILGIIAAIVAFGLLGVGYVYLLEWSSKNYSPMFSMFANSAVDFKDIALQLFVGFAILGVSIGVLSSGFFVRKHLRV